MNEKMISLDQIYERLKKKLFKETRVKKESSNLYECSSILLENHPKRIEISQSCWKFLKLKIHRSQTKEKEVLYPLTKEFYDFIEPLLIQFLEGNRLYSDFPEGEECTGPESIANVVIARRIIHKTPHEPSRFFISLKESDNIVKMKNLIGEPDDFNEGTEIWYFGNKIEMETLMRVIEYNKISKRRNEKQMKKIEILKETRIPGTNIILENKDKVFVEATSDPTTRVGSLLIGKKFSYVFTSSNAKGSFTSYNKPISLGRYLNIDVYRDEDLVEISSGNGNWFHFTKKDFIKNFKIIYRYLSLGHDANLAHDFPSSSNRPYYAL